jgi:hypothetical protein
MKSDKQQAASTSSSSILPTTTTTTTTNSLTLIKNECLGSRLAPSGAVVCLNFLIRLYRKQIFLRYRKKQIKVV